MHLVIIFMNLNIKHKNIILKSYYYYSIFNFSVIYRVKKIRDYIKILIIVKLTKKIIL